MNEPHYIPGDVAERISKDAMKLLKPTSGSSTTTNPTETNATATNPTGTNATATSKNSGLASSSFVCTIFLFYKEESDRSFSDLYISLTVRVRMVIVFFSSFFSIRFVC
jgi:hypothetical protein